LIGVRGVPSYSRKTAAFSVVELLVVIAIVGLLGVLAVNAFNQVMRGIRLTSAAQLVADAMNIARSAALTRNVPVQLRFYKLPDFDSTDGTPILYRGMQIFVCEYASTNAITKPILFPERVVASLDANKSSILQLTEMPPSISDPAKLSGMNYRYVTMTFGPNGIIKTASTTGGSTLSSTNEWYVTLHARRDLDTDSSWPENYATVKINPITGSAKIFQPR